MHGIIKVTILIYILLKSVSTKSSSHVSVYITSYQCVNCMVRKYKLNIVQIDMTLWYPYLTT